MPLYHLALRSEEQIPARLRKVPAWCTWKLEATPGGKPTKRPSISTLEPSRFYAWEDVRRVPRTEKSGVGFITTGGYDIGGATLLLVDIDSCRALDGQVVDDAAEWIEASSNSYTEVSPSGYGLRVVVAVKKLPPNLRASVRGTWIATQKDKKPGIQLFGLGPAGYVTMTGHRLEGTAQDVLTVDNLDALFEKWGMLAPSSAGEALPKPEGDAPSAAAITADVELQPYGKHLIGGHWRKVPNTSSASEAFHLLVRYALAAAKQHGDAAVRWLLDCTAWGRGEIDDSRDPGKYTRAEWVSKDVLRAVRKAPPPASQVFEDLGELPVEAPSEPLANGLDALLDEWQSDGPLVHLPTGVAPLDELTGGGLVLGSRVFLLGAPDAGKTALALQIADTYARQGISVGILGVDEEPTDLITRLLQRRAFTRTDCETREASFLDQARASLLNLPVWMFGSESTIEQAAVKLHLAAKARTGMDRPPCVLVLDSVQTVRCQGEDEEGSQYASVTKRVAAIRAVAKRYRMLVIATSEMNRAAYRAKRPEDQVNEMAAGKESGAIEYSARVLLALRSVPNAVDVTELRIAKNKHGRSHRADEKGIFLRLNRGTQTMTPDSSFAPMETETVEQVTRTMEDAGTLAALLTFEDLPVTFLIARAKTYGIPRNRCRDARDFLLQAGAIVEIAAGGNVKHNRLVATKLPPGCKAAFELALTRSALEGTEAPPDEVDEG